MKIILQTLVEIIFEYPIFFRVLGHPGTNKMKIFTYEVLGIKIG